MSTLAPASSPFQRIADALQATPQLEFSVQDLARAGQCRSTVALRCAERLAEERVVEVRMDSGGRLWWHWVGVGRG